MDENYDEVTKKYNLPKFLKGYKNVGETDVTVWRVEMADSAKINLKKLKEKWDYEGKYADSAVLKVPTGKWSLTSYYDTRHKDSNEILAEIRLVN